jgi:hypothetical protein
MSHDPDCVDINPLIGITATGVIDPATGLWYLTAKTYSEEFQNGKFSPDNPPGRFNGRYWQHAIHTEDLSEAQNWPVPPEGTVFRNNPNRSFIGGNQHSRPGALLVGDYVYTGYAGHCVQYNVTGVIIGYHKTTGKIVEAFATEGGPEPNTVKGGGVWMSGGGLSYDGRGSMYFSTGNGYASQLKATGNSVPGRSPPSALEEAVVNAKINDDGTISVIDFFMPWDKVQLDGADKDLGTTPLEILPSDVFSCQNHRRIGVVTGKSGKTYWLNLDSLGGYQNGADNRDDVIQTYSNENSVFAGVGVLPLSGGYIYISVTKYPTHVFQFSCNEEGNAVFTKVADTPDKNAYIIGTGHGTTTSLNGEEGTGLLWITDVEGQNLRIYDPIPPSDGTTLKLLKDFNIPGVTKFSRAAFGDRRVYIGTTQGYLYGFGSTYVSPLNCSSPFSFGTITINQISQQLTVTCTALASATVTNITLGSKDFSILDTPQLPFNLVLGKLFSLEVVATPQSVGVVSSDIIIETRNASTEDSSSTHITLKATGRSIKPLLDITPGNISFEAIVGQSTPEKTILFQNLGDTILTIRNITFSLVSENGPMAILNKTTDGRLQIGQLIITDSPGTIAPGSSAAISVTYNPDAPGNSTVYIQVTSDGGSSSFKIIGSAGTPPKAVVEFQTTDGSDWVQYTPGTPFSFGTVYASQTRNLLLRITNRGGTTAVPLPITISKPPFGIPGIIGKANNVDLAEGVTIAAGKSQSAVLYCAVPGIQVNTPGYSGTAVWTLNTGDLTFGKQDIKFVCDAAAQQVGPLLSNGTARYGYIGCFKENNPGRQLAINAYSDAKNNSNYRCINTCFASNYTFAGTEYSQECWCGNAIPIQKDLDQDCNFGCSGNGNQTCGGDGYLHDTPHISLFADSMKVDGNTTSLPLQITPNVGTYTFIGCYSDKSGKTLNEKTITSLVMTVQVCAAFCAEFLYFGLEYSSECYCGTNLNALSNVVGSSQCSMACKGSNSQYCGGPARMQVYQAYAVPAIPSKATNAVADSTTLTSVITSSTRTTSLKSATSISNSAGNITTATSSRTPLTTATSGSSTSSSISNTGSSPTSVNKSSVSTTSTVPTSTVDASCPALNSSTYTSPAGAAYRVECSIDRSGNDIKFAYTTTFAECLSLCDATPLCEGISWIAGVGVALPCYLKSGVGSPVEDARIWGAIRLANTATDVTSPRGSTSVVLSISHSSPVLAFGRASTSSTSTFAHPFSSSTPYSISVSQASTSALILFPSVPYSSFTPSTSTTPITTSPSSPISQRSTSRSWSTSTQASTKNSPPTPSGTPLSCPTANTTLYTTPTNSTYIIECSLDRFGKVLMFLSPSP